MSVRSLVGMAAIVLTVAAPLTLRSQSAPPVVVRIDTTALRRVLDSIADRHHGVVGYSVIDVETGARIGRRGDETFPTASLIKVGIPVTVFDLVTKGQR